MMLKLGLETVNPFVATQNLTWALLLFFTLGVLNLLLQHFEFFDAPRRIYRCNKYP